MASPNRMSALTALVIGIFGLGAVVIASATGVALYGLQIVDSKASAILGFAGTTIEGLPDLIESLPPAVGELLNDRRTPEYAGNIDVEARFVPHERFDGVRPVLTITNNGSEVVSLLAVRVVALEDGKTPLEEWTEVVATPIAIDDNWRGPLMPGTTRHIPVSSWSRISAEKARDLSSAVEISEIRLWRSDDES